MGYWTEVKDVFLKGVDLAVDGVKEGAHKAAVMGRESLAYTQLNANLFMEQRKLQTILADLGDRARDVYTEKKDFYADSAIAEIMGKLKETEDACKKLEEEIKNHRSKKEKE